MNVTKGENTSTIQITTKKQQSNSISIFINQGADKLDLEKTDPTNLTGTRDQKDLHRKKKCIPQQIKCSTSKCRVLC
jgi:hypothetical protein